MNGLYPPFTRQSTHSEIVHVSATGYPTLIPKTSNLFLLFWIFALIIFDVGIENTIEAGQLEDVLFIRSESWGRDDAYEYIWRIYGYTYDSNVDSLHSEHEK